MEEIISLGTEDEHVDYGTAVEEEQQQPARHVFDDDDPPPRKRRRTSRDQQVRYGDAEEVSRHQALILQLTRLGSSDRFGTYLKALSFQLTPAHLKTQDIEQLEETLQRVRCACMNKGSSDFFSTAALAVCQGVEVALTKSSVPIEAHGWAEMLKKDESFMDVLALIELSSNLTAGSPYALLVYSLLGTLGRTHQINRFLRARAEFAATQRRLEGAPSGEPSAEPGEEPAAPPSGESAAGAEEAEFSPPGENHTP